MEYTIRVEDITNGLATETTDFCLFGNYLGKFHIGDEVIITAKNMRNRRVATSVYNATTNTMVSPGFQIPAIAVRGMVSLGALLVIALLPMLKILVPLAIGGWILIKKILPKLLRI